MTSDQIIKMIYAGAIGGLCGYYIGMWGLLIGPAIIILANVIGLAFGDDTKA